VLYVSGQWIQRLTDYLRFDFRLIWRDERESDRLDSKSLEQWFDIDWTYRQTSVYAAFRNSFADSDVSDSIFHSVVVGFRREF
jgi:hypothetical protein